LSDTFIKYQLKALIARNIWDLSKYFEVLTDVDDTLQRALDLIKKKNMYSELIKTH
jgi:hypothetical protein